jgi:hypothetical protein
MKKKFTGEDYTETPSQPFSKNAPALTPETDRDRVVATYKALRANRRKEKLVQFEEKLRQDEEKLMKEQYNKRIEIYATNKRDLYEAIGLKKTDQPSKKTILEACEKAQKTIAGNKGIENYNEISDAIIILSDDKLRPKYNSKYDDASKKNKKKK